MGRSVVSGRMTPPMADARIMPRRKMRCERNLKPETVSKIAEFLSSLSDSHSEDARRLAGLSLQDGECDWDLLIQAQELAGRQANWVIVLAIADYMRAFCMKSARAYSVIFDALYHLGRSEEAEDTLREALPLFPKSHAITVKWARLATIQQDYQVAAQRWLAVLQDHPTIEECYKTGAFCLQQLGDAAGAAALLRDGMNILPQAIDVWLQYVATAITAGDVAEAKARWLRRQSEFSEDSDTSLLGAQIAFACNDFAEANALLEQSVRTTGGSETEEQNSLLRN